MGWLWAAGNCHHNEQSGPAGSRQPGPAGANSSQPSAYRSASPVELPQLWARDRDSTPRSDSAEARSCLAAPMAPRALAPLPPPRRTAAGVAAARAWSAGSARSVLVAPLLLHALQPPRQSRELEGPGEEAREEPSRVEASPGVSGPLGEPGRLVGLSSSAGEGAGCRAEF